MEYVYNFFTVPALLIGAGILYLAYGHLRGRK